ncbi:MAG: hypothetical protein NUV75_12990 [Gallionella sp.]|nr:hypothetical protein [Gallionella sp.]
MTNPAEKPTGLALLRVPFEAHQISKLPKATKAQTEAVKADYKAGIKCEVCGGWHHPKVVHLDYVGHAALTDRLLDADPNWNWEPVAVGQGGHPVLDGDGGMWIKLTVCGVTRLGYGDAQGKTGGNAVKERIGDALRNAAMRFGAALDLWHKGDLHIEEEPVKTGPGVIKPSDGAEARIGDKARLYALDRVHSSIVDCLNADAPQDAVKAASTITDPDEQVYVWGKLDSKQRSLIKRTKQEMALNPS